MNKYSNPNLKTLAQNLRRNMTEEERHLWFDFLRLLPVTFQRQKVIGPYIVDFYCAKAKMVVELDGAQHFEKEGKEKDRERDAYLVGLGLRVFRYSNVELKRHFDAVCERYRTAFTLTAVPSLPLEG